MNTHKLFDHIYRKWLATQPRHQKDETFVFMGSLFDVTLGNFLTRDTQVVTVNYQAQAAFVGMKKDSEYNGNEFAIMAIRTTNWQAANLSFPILIATIELEGETTHLCIDGWHRIKKALETDVLELPAKILTPEETRWVMGR